jgi:hypothetical protein
LALLPVGLAVPSLLPGPRWALTPPFHHNPGGPGLSVLCGAVPRVTPAGRYPAPLSHGVRTFLPARSEDHTKRPSGRTPTPMSRVQKPELPASHEISPVSRYSGTLREDIRFRLRDYHPLWCDFPDTSTNDYLCNSLESPSQFLKGPTTPAVQRQRAITYNWFGLLPVRSPLLGESLLMYFPGGT